MVIVAIFTWIVSYLLIDHLDVSHFATPILHSLLGVVISLLLVFRTNTAYERWWEGRKLWGGLVNISRNLALKMNALLPASDTETRAKYSRLIILFPDVLKDHLRNKINPNVPEQLHQPNYVINELMQVSYALNRSGTITGEQLLTIHTEITEYANICGACERIRKTPIPYSYSLFLKKFIFAYVMTAPFGLIKDLGYLTVPAVTFLFYVLVSLEVIAEEIEDPFGEEQMICPQMKLLKPLPTIRLKYLGTNPNKKTSRLWHLFIMKCNKRLDIMEQILNSKTKYRIPKPKTENRNSKFEKGKRNPPLPAQDPGKHQWCNNCGITFYYKFRGMDIKFTPGNFFVRNSS
jgi:putative membrane protein